MSGHHNFVPGIEFECARDIVKIVRDGELKEKKFEVAQHGAWIVGCGAALLEGREPIVGSDAPQIQVEHLNVRECCDLIEDRLPAEGTAQFNWREALEMVRLVMQLLRELDILEA